MLRLAGPGSGPEPGPELADWGLWRPWWLLTSLYTSVNSLPQLHPYIAAGSGWAKRMLIYLECSLWRRTTPQWLNWSVHDDKIPMHVAERGQLFKTGVRPHLQKQAWQRSTMGAHQSYSNLIIWKNIIIYLKWSVQVKQWSCQKKMRKQLPMFHTGQLRTVTSWEGHRDLTSDHRTISWQIKSFLLLTTLFFLNLEQLTDYKFKELYYYQKYFFMAAKQLDKSKTNREKMWKCPSVFDPSPPEGVGGTVMPHPGTIGWDNLPSSISGHWVPSKEATSATLWGVAAIFLRTQQQHWAVLFEP